MWYEFKKRFEYNFMCLFGIEGGCGMGADLAFSMMPFGGMWVNEFGAFDRYEDAMSARDRSDV